MLGRVEEDLGDGDVVVATAGDVVLHRVGVALDLVAGRDRAVVRCGDRTLGQLDRLAGVIGMDTVELGIVPLGAPLNIPAANGFWILDDRLVIAEDWHAELWLNDADSVATYRRVWDTLRESAVYGVEARELISTVRGTLHSR